MIYEINYAAYAIIATAITWPAVFVFLLARDWVKKNPFRPWYRAAWPFLAMLELIGYFGG